MPWTGSSTASPVCLSANQCWSAIPVASAPAFHEPQPEAWLNCPGTTEYAPLLPPVSRW